MGRVNLTRGVAFVGLARAAHGRLNIHNHCRARTSVVLSHNGSCDYGPSGQCISKGGQPWHIAPGDTTGFAWNDDGAGTSIKISKQGHDGILQFEYTMAPDGLYWDLSNLDGSGGGLVGTPFAHDNVKVSPTGAGSDKETCLKLRCRAGKTCYDSYQHPDDPNTKWCPHNTGHIWVDLCQPGDLFEQKGVDDDVDVLFVEIPETPTCEDCQDYEETDVIDGYLCETNGTHPSQGPHNWEDVDADGQEHNIDGDDDGEDHEEEESD